MAGRVDLPKSNLRERRRRRRVVLAGLVAAAVVFIFIVLVALSWAPFLRITSVSTSGEKTVSSENIKNTSWAALAGGYGHLFAKNDIFLYPRKTLQNELLAQFPALSTVAIHASSFHSLEVDVTERQPVALWCGEDVASSSSCFLIDAGGVVYAPAVVYSGDVYQKYYGAVIDVTNGKAASSSDALPWRFLTQDMFHSLFALTSALQQQTPDGEKLVAQNVYVDENGDVHLAFENGFTLLFAAQSDSADVLDDFNLALTADIFKKHPISDFEYLDLRFGDKLYYKLKTN